MMDLGGVSMFVLEIVFASYLSMMATMGAMRAPAQLALTRSEPMRAPRFFVFQLRRVDSIVLVVGEAVVDARGAVMSLTRSPDETGSFFMVGLADYVKARGGLIA
jgi:hypothetical protein